MVGGEVPHLDVLSEFTHESLAFRVARKLGEAGEGNCRSIVLSAANVCRIASGCVGPGRRYCSECGGWRWSMALTSSEVVMLRRGPIVAPLCLPGAPLRFQSPCAAERTEF